MHRVAFTQKLIKIENNSAKYQVGVPNKANAAVPAGCKNPAVQAVKDAPSTATLYR